MLTKDDVGKLHTHKQVYGAVSPVQLKTFKTSK